MQLSLPFAQANIPSEHLFSGRDLGTFKDSLRAPIYRWFKYPAGYSYKFIQESFDLFGIKSGGWVYDPFSGTGTTLVYAKQTGVNAYGVEAHSFVHWVAEVKLHWEFDLQLLRQSLRIFLEKLNSYISDHSASSIKSIFPELIYKCYHPADLLTLYLIREYISEAELENPTRDFIKLALTDTLRESAAAGTGWPYISPPKDINAKPPKNAFEVFQKILWKMFQDLHYVENIKSEAIIQNILGDCREKQSAIEAHQIQLALTSPPYLNNYDYADRTRLETYFWGITHSWREITEQFRTKLIVAATTQVNRSLYDIETVLNPEFQALNPRLYNTIQASILELSQRRLQKSGKKDYDLMTALYFNDILQMLKETYRILQPKGHLCLVLGDSAPYGIHIATDDLIGQLGVSLGFKKYTYYELRQRGNKWKDNPQRHQVPLREGIVVLEK